MSPVAHQRLPAGERRKRTLLRAMKVFARKGFNGTTSRSLAKATGVSEAMVFRQFRSKRGLYRAIIEHKIETSGEVFPSLSAAHAADEADEVFFREVARSVLDDMEEDPTFLRLLLFSALEKAELSRIFVDERVSKVIDGVAEYVARRTRAGAFIRLDPHLVAISFIGMVAQFVQAKQVLGLRRFDHYQRHEVVDCIVRMTLGGLLAQPSNLVPEAPEVPEVPEDGGAG